MCVVVPCQDLDFHGYDLFWCSGSWGDCSFLWFWCIWCLSMLITTLGNPQLTTLLIISIQIISPPTEDFHVSWPSGRVWECDQLWVTNDILKLSLYKILKFDELCPVMAAIGSTKKRHSRRPFKEHSSQVSSQKCSDFRKEYTNVFIKPFSNSQTNRVLC